jgi:hypothetical protein
MEMKAALEAKKTPLELFTIVDRDAILDNATDALQKSLTDAWSDGKLYDAEKAHLKQLAFEYEAAGGDMSDALVQAIKAGDWAAAGKYAGEEFAKISLAEPKSRCRRSWRWSKIRSLSWKPLSPSPNSRRTT